MENNYVVIIRLMLSSGSITFYSLLQLEHGSRIRRVSIFYHGDSFFASIIYVNKRSDMNCNEISIFQRPKDEHVGNYNMSTNGNQQ